MGPGQRSQSQHSSVGTAVPLLLREGRWTPGIWAPSSQYPRNQSQRSWWEPQRHFIFFVKSWVHWNGFAQREEPRRAGETRRGWEGVTGEFLPAVENQAVKSQCP